MKKNKQIAVITGDIVKSSALNEAQKRFIQNGIKHFIHEGILLRPRFYRGDSFQLAVKPMVALLLSLKFRMEMRRKSEASDLRISIGIGEVATWNDDVLLADGPAFQRSGKNLDSLKKKDLHIIVVTGNNELDRELETYCYMADVLLKSLSSVQANVLFYKLNRISQEQVGEILHISQPSVSKTLKAANWKVIEKFLERYEQIIEKHYGNFE
ncbi:MAG TPA: SatD family protein [Tangfeifania sp.]|nr:SatD family protein [Tangfeifania sp.]